MQLRPEFEVDDASTSIIVIDQPNIPYSRPNDDPIFHISTKSSGTRYLASNESIPVIGCADSTEIREVETGREFVLLGPLLYDKGAVSDLSKAYNIFLAGRDSDSTGLSDTSYNGNTFSRLSSTYDNAHLSHLHLLSLLLYSSTAASAIDIPRERTLEASRMIIGGVSLPLDPRQWRIEVEKIFKITLARVEVNMRAIAAGEGRDSDSTYDVLADFPTDYCAQMKIHAEGYKNINVIGLAGIMFLVASLWVLTLETKDSIVLLWLCTHIISLLVVRFWNSGKAVWLKQGEHNVIN